MNNRTLRLFIVIEVICIGFVFLVIGLTTAIGAPENWYVAAIIWTFVVLAVALVKLAIKRHGYARTLLKIDPYEETVANVLYSSGQDELRFTKGLQWNLVYYILVAFGVLYALSEALNRLPLFEKDAGSIVLFILNCMTFDYGIYMICELQFKLREHRIQLDKSKYYKDGYFEGGKFNQKRYNQEKEDDLRFWRDPRITIMLLFATSVGFVLMSLKLWMGFHALVIGILRAIHA